MQPPRMETDQVLLVVVLAVVPELASAMRSEDRVALQQAVPAVLVVQQELVPELVAQVVRQRQRVVLGCQGARGWR